MSSQKRIGFHYFQDTHHYRNSDLDIWLPRLVALDASWLVLISPIDRAIPESFLRRLIASSIEPVIYFPLDPEISSNLDDLELLFRVYAKWGVRYVTFFNKPNLRSFWKTAEWTKVDLVERFLDIFLPLAERCLMLGLIPIFPPLEPGGDYWDTVFLRASLQGIKRRGFSRLLDTMVIGAIARIQRQDLNWGSGGPERWPESVPYSHPRQGETHLGFRIFDWYLAVIRSCLIKPMPIFLFEVASSLDMGEDTEEHTKTNLAIARLLMGEPVKDLHPVPSEVIGASFWLLAASSDTNPNPMTWFRPDGENLPIVSAMQTWIAGRKREDSSEPDSAKKIKHYLLLPGLEDDHSEINIDHIRPLIKKYKPTIGFSVEEAKQADRVTIINFNHGLPKDIANQLRYAGCLVQQIDDMAQLLHLEI